MTFTNFPMKGDVGADPSLSEVTLNRCESQDGS